MPLQAATPLVSDQYSATCSRRREDVRDHRGPRVLDRVEAAQDEHVGGEREQAERPHRQHLRRSGGPRRGPELAELYTRDDLGRQRDEHAPPPGMISSPVARRPWPKLLGEALPVGVVRGLRQLREERRRERHGEDAVGELVPDPGVQRIDGPEPGCSPGMSADAREAVAERDTDEVRDHVQDRRPALSACEAPHARGA